ncbi:MAG TPA: glucose-1-phosphate adenylyltransferase [Opitutaceae bacterium]|nr:glucose-1-phosphate adenylyltransferase [Opitutaceae bacterium]
MNSPKHAVLAVVMGGGRGTRLYPLTQERCKPAVPLAGKYRLVDIPISNCLNSDINRIFLLTQFNTASLHRHVQTAYHFDPFGAGFVDILAAEQTEKSENWYQGTADAVRRNLIHFRAFPHDVVLILSGDQLYRMDFRKIIEQHVATGAEVTVATTPVPASQVGGLGIMRVSDDLAITEFVEKTKDPEVVSRFIISETLERRLTAAAPGGEKHCLASMGIYVFNRAALAAALDNTMTDFGREIIPGLLERMRICAYIFEGYWEDIGTVRAFFEANLALAQPLPPFNFFHATAPVFTALHFLPPAKLNRCALDHAIIGDGSILTDSTLRRCVIGSRSFVGEGATLEEVVMMGADAYQTEDEIKADIEAGRPHIGIGRNGNIRKAIIDKNARIGDNVTLSPEGKPDGTYAHGIIIRDGVLVVPKGGVVPTGATV